MKLIQYSKKYIVPLFNVKPTIKGKGSVIFLHIAKGKYLPTKGCVAIKKKDFLIFITVI